MRFHSILFDQPDRVATLTREEPAFFADLNLNQVVASLTAGREEYDLKPFLYSPLQDVETVRYRHEILRDLENEAVFTCVATFARQIRQMRQHLVQAQKLRFQYQQERWFLDAVEIYCDAVKSLAGELSRLDVNSRGFQALREYLAAYIMSDGFVSLAADTQRLHDELASVTYCVYIRGNRITVSKYDGEPDGKEPPQAVGL